jgi:hypothetical protein
MLQWTRPAPRPAVLNCISETHETGMTEDFLDTPPDSAPPWSAYLHPLVLAAFLQRPRVRYVLSWLLAVVVAGAAVYEAWTCWDEQPPASSRALLTAEIWSFVGQTQCGQALGIGPAPYLLGVADPLVRARRARNWGHATIDFGGQYLMGRMILEGRGRELYSRSAHQEVLEKTFPNPAATSLNVEPTDAAKLLAWMVFRDRPGEEGLGGPMYPPVHALLYAPLTWMRAPLAYRLTQLLALLAVVLCGRLVEQLSDGRVWWPLAVAALIAYPGFAGAFDLAQNAVFTLLILLVGWWQLKEGHPWRGGLLWGLLAYKPVWAVAFLLGPLLLRRWRFAAAMVLGGAALVAATLPVVGVQVWKDWLKVGNIGAWEYTRQQSWILLGRELLGVPRRWLLHFSDGIATDDSLAQSLPAVLGTLLWLTPPALTVLVVWLRRRRVSDVTGPGAAFVLLGAYFACYHFMYYDALLAALPLTLLFAEWWRFVPVYRWREPIPPPALDWATGARTPLLFVLVRGGWMAAFALRPRWWRDLPALVLLVLLLTSPIFFALWKTQSPPPPPWATHFAIAFVLGLVLLLFAPGLLVLGRGRLFARAWGSLLKVLCVVFCVLGLALLLGTLVTFGLRREDLAPPPWDTLFTLGLWLWCAWEVAADVEPAAVKEMPPAQHAPAAKGSETAVFQLE